MIFLPFYYNVWLFDVKENVCYYFWKIFCNNYNVFGTERSIISRQDINIENSRKNINRMIVVYFNEGTAYCKYW